MLKEGELMDVREVIKEKGRQEGMQEGIQKGRQEIVLNMLKEKVEMAFISKITGFSKEEIEKLKKNS